MSETRYSRRLPLAIIYGGRGEEREISKRSAESFIKACRKADIPIVRVFIDRDGSFYIESDDISPTTPEKQALGGECNSETCEKYSKSGELQPNPKKSLMPTYPVRLLGKSGFLVHSEVLEVRGAFPILHGDFGEDGTVQGTLTTAGIRLFGADTLSGAITSDKAYTKMIAEYYGIPTVPFVTVTRGRVNESIASCEALGYPLFVKPCSLGSSIGASVVRSRKDLVAALDLALGYSERALCERLIEDKRELECAYFSVGEKRLITPPAEVLVKGFYNFDKKYRLPAEVVPVAEVSEEIKEKIMRLTEVLSVALSVKNISRFDYFLLPSGEIFLNEINSCPGMTSSSLYLRMLELSGLSVCEFARLVYGDPSW